MPHGSTGGFQKALAMGMGKNMLKEQQKEK